MRAELRSEATCRCVYKWPCRVTLVLGPWTQRIEVNWRPELRFYETRIGILRQLENQGILQAFRVRDHAIDGRLFGGDHVLTIKQNGISLQLLRPQAEAAAGWDAVALAVEQINPTQATSITLSLQYVVGLEGDFPTLVARGQEQLLSVPLAGDVAGQDWALLLDLKLEGETESNGQVEFGITANAELPSRLARLVGKMAERTDIDPEHWKPAEFPSVSLFVDSKWASSVDNVDDPLNNAWAYWDSVRQQTNSLVEGWHQAMAINTKEGSSNEPDIAP